jgi:AhpD family alkylhydroperoxidase
MKEAEEAVKKLSEKMGGFTPDTLNAIKKHHPELAKMIHDFDRVMNEDGALDKKTKRLIALACVATRMCKDCVYPQARVAMNYGATKDEIIEALHVASVVGGIPVFSVAKDALEELFK